MELIISNSQYKKKHYQICISYKGIAIIKVSKFGHSSRGRPESSLFNRYYTEVQGEGATPFPELLHFTLDTYLILLSVKQVGIKYHF